MNAKPAQFVLIRSTRQPGGGPGPARATLPIADRVKLLAAFLFRQAGAMSAMELDLHKKMVIFNLFTPTTPGGAPLGCKLSPAMRGNANRHLVADHRDFVTVTQR